MKPLFMALPLMAAAFISTPALAGDVVQPEATKGAKLMVQTPSGSYDSDAADPKAMNHKEFLDEPILWSGNRADGHAPIGVMADHTHNAGEFMISLRYMAMRMDDLYVGSDTVSDRNVITPTGRGGQGYLVTPTDMETQMVMASMMYAPTDELTLMVSAPYIWKSMNHIRRDGLTFNTKSEGFGDTKFGGLYKVYDDNRQRIHFSLFVSAPTGSLSESDSTPVPFTRTFTDSVLPFPMQLGSGTWDVLPGVTYLGQTDHWSWGAQASGVLRPGTNEFGYTLGNRFEGTAWLSYLWTQWLSTSMRVAGSVQGKIDGLDNQLSPAAPSLIPTADPDAQGGNRVDLAWGVNLYVPEGALENNRLAAEFILPVYQNLNGPQLGAQWMVVAGWQYSW